MSLNITPLRTVQVRYPPTNINDARDFAILKGGSNFSIRTGTTQSWSTTNTTFSLPPANPETIYDRRMWLKQPVTITFTGTCSTGENLLKEGCDAFRAYPLSTCMNNISLTINNTTNQMNMKDGIQAFMRYHNPGCKRQIEYSQTPSMLDNTQNYADGFGSNRNPLGGFIDDSFDYARGSFPYDSVAQIPSVNPATPTTSVVTATLTEPLFISPCLFGDDTGPGLIGV